jgi:EKC/KEOPS complex subunit PCC1/LAGE3
MFLTSLARGDWNGGAIVQRRAGACSGKPNGWLATNHPNDHHQHGCDIECADAHHVYRRERPRPRLPLPHVRANTLIPQACDLLTTPPHRKLEIPFPTKRLADIAQKALGVDKELSPLVRRTLSLEDGPDSNDATFLNIQYEATTNRMLRVAVNSFLDSLHLTVEVMEQLDEDVLEQKQG